MRCAVVLGAALLASTATAHAEEAARLESVITVEPDPSGCLSAAALRSRVSHWLAISASQRGVTVVVHLTKSPLGFSVLRDGVVEATRRFAPPNPLPLDCAERTDTLSVAIALALEHAVGHANARAADTTDARSSGDRGERVDRAAPQPPANQPPKVVEAGAPAIEGSEAETPTDAVPAAAPVRAVRDEGTHAAESRTNEADVWLGSLHAGGALLIEALPGSVVGFGLGAELRRAGSSFGLTGIGSFESERPLGQGTVHARLLALRAHACRLLRLDLVELEGCLGVAAGLILARGEGFDDDRRATLGWVAPLLRGALRLPSDEALSLRLAFDGTLNALRPRLDQRGGAMPHAMPGLAGAALALELRVELP